MFKIMASRMIYNIDTSSQIKIKLYLNLIFYSIKDMFALRDTPLLPSKHMWFWKWCNFVFAVHSAFKNDVVQFYALQFLVYAAPAALGFWMLGTLLVQFWSLCEFCILYDFTVHVVI